MAEHKTSESSVDFVPVAARSAQAKVTAVDDAGRPTVVIAESVSVVVTKASTPHEGRVVVVGNGSWSLAVEPVKGVLGSCCKIGDVFEVHIWDAPPAGIALKGIIEKRPSKLSTFRKEYDNHTLTLSTGGCLFISSKKGDDVEVHPRSVEDVGPREFIITGKREYYLRAQTPAIKAAWTFAIASAIRSAAALTATTARDFSAHASAYGAVYGVTAVAGATAVVAAASSGGTLQAASASVWNDSANWGALCAGAIKAASHFTDGIPFVGVLGCALRTAVARFEGVVEARGECAEILRHLTEAGEALDYIVDVEKDKRVTTGDAVDIGIAKVVDTIHAIAGLVDEFSLSSGLRQAAQLDAFRARRTTLINTLERDQVGLLFRLQGDTRRRLDDALVKSDCTEEATKVEVKQLWALQLVEIRSCAARVKALEAEALRITRAQRVAVEQQQKAASFCATMTLELGDADAAVEAATTNYEDEDKEVEKKIDRLKATLKTKLLRDATPEEITAEDINARWIDHVQDDGKTTIRVVKHPRGYIEEVMKPKLALRKSEEEAALAAQGVARANLLSATAALKVSDAALANGTVRIASLIGSMKSLGGPGKELDEADWHQLAAVVGIYRAEVVERMFALQFELQGLRGDDMFNRTLLHRLGALVTSLQEESKTMRLHVDAEKAAAQKLRADDEVKESGTRADIKQLFDLAWKHRDEIAQLDTRAEDAENLLEKLEKRK